MAAKSSKGGKSQSVRLYQEKPKVNKKGIHSKKKTSTLKSSKNYKKPYRGQGK